jgi:hypothetical protein
MPSDQTTALNVLRIVETLRSIARGMTDEEDKRTLGNADAVLLAMLKEREARQRRESQTTTLTEALRAWAPLVAEGYTVPAASKAILEAAHEIERLRALLTQKVGEALR